MKNEILSILDEIYIDPNGIVIEEMLDDILEVIAKRDEECLPLYEDPHWEDITQDSRGIQLKNAWRAEVKKRLEETRA